MFSCGFCEISKNTFYCRTLPVAASENCNVKEQTVSFFFTNIHMPKQTTPVFYFNKKKSKYEATGRKVKHRFLNG